MPAHARALVIAVALGTAGCAELASVGLESDALLRTAMREPAIPNRSDLAAAQAPPGQESSMGNSHTVWPSQTRPETEEAAKHQQ